MSGLEDVIKGINKKFGKEVAFRGIGHLKVRRIPFTSPRLNYITYGGIPRGLISMFAGMESSGKTTTALDSIKNAQIVFQNEWQQECNELLAIIEENKDKKTAKAQVNEAQTRLNYLQKRGPLKIVYFDAEGTLDGEWSKKIGVDVDNVYLVKLYSQTAEQFLDIVIDTVQNTDDVGMIVIDTLAVLIPQIIHDESMEKKSMGGNANVNTIFVNKVCPILSEKEIACILINQARDDLANPYADFKIPGGKALKHACSVILTFQKGKFINAAGEEQKQSYETPAGNLVWVRVQKTKIFKPDRRVGFYTLSYDYGVDVLADLIPMAQEFGIIEQAGAWFRIMNPENGEILTYENGEVLKFQGRLSLLAFLRETPEIVKFIENYVMAKITGTDCLYVDEATDMQAIQEASDLSDDIILKTPEFEEQKKFTDEVDIEEKTIVEQSNGQSNGQVLEMINE